MSAGSCLLSDLGGGMTERGGVGVSGVRGPLLGPAESPEFDIGKVADAGTVSGYPGLRKGLCSDCGGSAVMGDLTPGLFFPTLSGAGGWTISSVGSGGTVLIVLDGVITRAVLLVAGSTRLAGI